MHLRRISIQGFKSFADRVDFDFSPGVTCIVGPNGCGKSNVIDAYKWVLGEQSAKLLRGRQMTDMIFNGSSSRRSSGMARVDLAFDNSKGTLPVELDEVVVTRKLYRSGESEYLINDEQSRLKDIRELFLDTGVGADAYSVIEQGRVDALLTSSPTDRRAIFEEAAGIAKYKARKREADRKLDRTQQNLLRVTDIIEEVQKRLRSVKLQAGKARNFQTYEARLKELRAGFSLAEFHRLTQSLESLTQEGSSTTDQSTQLRTAIDRNEAESSELLETANQLSEELSVTEHELTRVRSEIAGHQAHLEAAHRRISEHRSILSNVDQRVAQLSSQREQYQEQLTRVEAESESLENEARSNETRVRELSDEDKRLERALTELRAKIEDEKGGLVDLVRQSTHLRNEITRLNSQSESLRSQQTRLGERDAAIRSEMEELLSRRSSLESRRQEIDQLIETETTSLDEKTREGKDLEVRRAELAESLADARERRSGLRSRLQVLAELERKMEGVGTGVRALLERKAANPEHASLNAVCGMLGDLIEADVEHADIIMAAIGEHDQHVVIDNGQVFFADHDMIASLPGRLNTVCLDRLPPVINSGHEISHPGFVAIASDLVRCAEPYQRLVKQLLSRTVVVETLADALELATNDSARRRYVTRRGEVVDADGTVSVGPPTSRAGLIARKSERRELGIQLESVEESVRTLEDELNRTAAQAKHLAQLQEDLRNAVNQANRAKIEADSALERVREAIERLTREQPLITGEVTMIQEQLAEAQKNATEREVTVGALDRENEDREQAVAQYNQKVETLTADRDQVRSELTEARVTAGQLNTKRTSLAESIEHLRHGIESATTAVESAHHEREEARKRINESEEHIRSGQTRLNELTDSADKLEAAAIQMRRQREMVRVETEELAARTRNLRSKLSDVETRLHELEVQRNTATVRRDELTTRVSDELGINLVELYNSYDESDQDWEAVETEIDELRQKIARLGNVNLDAINEQEELEEREQFLTNQWDDLEESRRQLESLIGKLDDECTERFRTALETIRTNFRELFRKLFGGGKADIVLDDPDNLLESGIDILAKPPGKELQRISLMSGGEKTMTAIALLMSIFRSRPSPLALLDEVDAALDEANNARYNAIIQEFLDRSQFILVTHSKRTMSIADHLYGVTMQEPGVSSRVSVKFEDNDDHTAVA
jgi:chromosome segregation protein